MKSCDSEFDREFTSELEVVQGSLLKLASFLCRDRSRAKDLLQETNFKMWRSRGSFELGTDFSSWARTIMRNIFFNDSRNSRNAPDVCEYNDHLLVDDGLSGFDDTSDLLYAKRANHVVRETVNNAIASIGQSFRDVINLREMEELSYKQISEKLGLPPGTVMSRIHRGRKELEKVLRSNWADMSYL